MDIGTGDIFWMIIGSSIIGGLRSKGICLNVIRAVLILFTLSEYYFSILNLLYLYTVSVTSCTKLTVLSFKVNTLPHASQIPWIDVGTHHQLFFGYRWFIEVDKDLKYSLRSTTRQHTCI